MNDYTNHETRSEDNEMTPSLDYLNHLTELEQLLSDADISNIDIIAVGESYDELYDYAEKYGQILDDGRLQLTEKIEEYNRPDKFDVFKVSDRTLVTNNNFHFRLNEYKILRPEVTLSFKGAKRRSKDEKDIQIMESSDIFNIPEWDWERVNLVPLWERRSDQPNLFERMVWSIHENGIVYTTIKGAQLLRSKAIPETILDRILPSTTVESRLVDPLYTDLELRYPLPNLLSRQYTGDVFERDDIIATLLTKEGEETVPTIEKVSSGDVIITPSGKIHSGVQTLAKYCTEVKKTSQRPLMVKIQLSEVEEALEPVSISSIPDLTSSEKELIKQRRYELLEQSGALFYSIIWPPANTMFDEIEELVADEFNIIESNDYYIEDGFGDFVHDIYAADERNEEWFYRTKRHELLQYDPLIRVCKLEVPDPEFRTSKESLLATEVYDAKIKIREEIQNLDEDYMYSTRLHMTDNFTNNLHVLRMLENINSKKYNGFESD